MVRSIDHFYILRGHRRAVRKRHALPQGDGPCQPVLGGGVAFGQPRLHAATVRGGGEERLEDVVEHIDRVGLYRFDRIEARDIPGTGKDDVSPGHGLRRGRAGRNETRGEREGPRN